MSKKFIVLLLTAIIASTVPACSYFFPENKYEYTTWKSSNIEEKNSTLVLELNIYSGNRMRASYGKTKNEYLYYIEDNRIKVTNIKDYSQSVIKLKNDKLIINPEYFGIKVNGTAKEISLKRDRSK